MGREFELKYRADTKKIATIRAHYGDFSPISMETAYYDTPSLDLRQRHWTLRRRFENGRSVCTVKTPLEDGSRGEWELECGDIESAIPELCKRGVPEELRLLTENGVAPFCGARFTRLVRLLSDELCTVELALDQGVLLGGGQELPFAEVEVELKDGSQDAAVRFAQRLAAEFELSPEPKSKLQRAMELTE